MWGLVDAAGFHGASADLECMWWAGTGAVALTPMIVRSPTTGNPQREQGTTVDSALLTLRVSTVLLRTRNVLGGRVLVH